MKWLRKQNLPNVSWLALRLIICSRNSYVPLSKIFKRASLQPKPVEDLHGSEDVQSLLSRHLDQDSSERRAIYNRLQTIEGAIKRRRSRGIARYLIAVGRADLLRVNCRGFFHPLLLLSLFDRSRGGDYRLLQHPKIGKSASRSEPWS